MIGIKKQPGNRERSQDFSVNQAAVQKYTQGQSLNNRFTPDAQPMPGIGAKFVPIGKSPGGAHKTPKLIKSQFGGGLKPDS